MSTIHTAGDHLVYECPHCGSKVEVDEGQLDEIIECPNTDCGQPFEATAPRGRLVRSSEATPLRGDVLQAHGAADVEKSVLVRHPAMFRNAPLQYLAYLVLIVGGALVGWAAAAAAMPIVAFFGTFAAVAGLVGLLGWWIQTMFRSLTVTNKRTIYREGIISRRTNEVQHDDVRNIQVDQNFFQRLFNVGRVAVSSSGQDDLEIDVRGIPDPEGVAATIRKYQ